MPTYGYRCENGHEFDVRQRMSDEPKAVCPVCGAQARRLFFPAGIVFKGAGFYKTDSRKGASDGAASSTGTSSAKGGESSSSSAKGGETSSTSTASAGD